MPPEPPPPSGLRRLGIVACLCFHVLTAGRGHASFLEILNPKSVASCRRHNRHSALPKKALKTKRRTKQCQSTLTPCRSIADSKAAIPAPGVARNTASPSMSMKTATSSTLLFDAATTNQPAATTTLPKNSSTTIQTYLPVQETSLCEPLSRSNQHYHQRNRYAQSLYIT